MRGTTSAGCGPSTVPSSRRRPSTPRVTAAGSRHRSIRSSRSPPPRPTSCRTSHPTADTPPTLACSDRPASPAVRSTALAAGEATGSGNGVFRYGADGGFPNASWGNANYWVDLVFDVLPDVVGPMVANVIPAPDLVAVDRRTGRRPVRRVGRPRRRSSSVSPAPTMRPSPGPPPGADAETVELPARRRSWLAGTRYTAALTAADVVGNAMVDPYVWSFTTAVAAGQYPVTIWTTAAVPANAAADDPSTIELGVKFGVDIAGAITGIRFYKGVGNVGPHTLAVDVGRAAARLGRRRERERRRMAAGLVRRTDPGRAGPLVRRQLPHADRPILGDRRRTLRHRGPAAAEAPASATVGGNGVYRYGAGGFPDGSYGDSNYFVDVLFTDLAGAALSRPVFRQRDRSACRRPPASPSPSANRSPTGRSRRNSATAPASPCRPPSNTIPVRPT